jgi:hypothetical protein
LRSGWPPIPASSCSTCPPTAPKPTRSKNTQQTTPGAHRKRNRVQVTYPHHPLTGQTVEVIRPYHKEDQSYWDIALPDGTRAFVPESWTRGDASPPSLTPGELDARAVLALAKMVADLQAHHGQRGAPGDEHPASPVGAVSARTPRAATPGLSGSQPQATSRSSGGQS